MSEIDKRNKLGEEPFAYQIMKSGKVAISYRGKQIKIVKDKEAERLIEKIKAVTDVPVGVGFGISDAASAKAMGVAADAVIVGSAFVKQFATLAPEQAVIETVNKVKELRAALDELV